MAVTEVAAPDASATQQESGMLESLHVRNFRGLTDLKVKGLGRINLFAGRNNSGKTALLEAIFLLSGAGSPSIAWNANILRGAHVIAGSDEVVSDAVRESLWKPMFYELDVSKTIEIDARHSSLGPLSLQISLERQRNIKVRLDGQGEELATKLQNSLTFSYDSSASGEVTSHISLNDQDRKANIYTESPDMEVQFASMYLASRSADHRQEAVSLGELRRQKQGDLILNALKIIEPRLESIEDNSASGVPMIWGDIGLRELVPLAAMGEGLARAARLFIGMIHVQKGVVMVDEIENGFHYSVVPGIWEAIDQVSRDFNVQVFATTHSRECVRAAYKALGDEGFVYHRLRADEDGNRCVTYDPIALSGSLHHNFEIR